MKHPHAELITEWIKDTRRPVEWCYPDRTDWIYTPAPEWSCNKLYRFKPHKWQECIDAQNAGKMVQGRDRRYDKGWEDTPCWSFDSPTMEYRIKPDTIKYRVALMRDHAGAAYMRDHAGAAYTDTFHQHFETVQQGKHFIRWLEPVKEVEL